MKYQSFDKIENDQVLYRLIRKRMLGNFIQQCDATTCSVIPVSYATQVLSYAHVNSRGNVWHKCYESGFARAAFRPRSSRHTRHLASGDCVVLVMTPTDSSRLLKDIKGDNVLVSTTERNGLKEFVVKLIDFGCAKKPGVDDDGVALEMFTCLLYS